MAPPRPVGSQPPGCLAQHVEDARGIDAHDRGEVIDRVVGQRGDVALDAGVVEDEVRHAEALGGRIEEGRHAGGVRDVCVDDRHGVLAGERGAQPPGLLEPLRGDGQVREDQPGAGGGQPDGHRPPEVAGRPGDEGDRAREVVRGWHGWSVALSRSRSRRRSPSGPKTWTGPRTLRKSWSPRATLKSASTRTRTRVDWPRCSISTKTNVSEPSSSTTTTWAGTPSLAGARPCGRMPMVTLPWPDLRELLGHRRVHGHPGRAEDDGVALVGRGQEVHGRRADEAGHEEVGRVAVQRVRAPRPAA